MNTFLRCPECERVAGVALEFDMVFEHDLGTKLAQMFPQGTLIPLLKAIVSASDEVEVCSAEIEPGYIAGVQLIRLTCRSFANYAAIVEVSRLAGECADAMVPLTHRPQNQGAGYLVTQLGANRLHLPVVRTAWLWLTAWWRDLFRDLASSPLSQRDRADEETLLRFLTDRIALLSARWPELEAYQAARPVPARLV